MKIPRRDLMPPSAKAATTEQPQSMDDVVKAHRDENRERIQKGRTLNDAQRRSFDHVEFDRQQRFYGRG